MRQQGFALVELAIALLIATLLAIWGSSQLVDRINDAAAQSAATWMSSVRMAAHAYLERNRSALQLAEAPGALAHLGYADWSRPGLPEFKAAGLLSAGFPEHGIRGLSAVVQVLRSGSCPGTACRLEALVHGQPPLPAVLSSSSGEQVVAQWLLAAQGQGGAVTASRPDRVGGAAFEFPNPAAPHLQALPPGTVAMAVTVEQLASADYLRVRDARDPLFQGDVTVGQDLRAQADVDVQGRLLIGAEAVDRGPCQAANQIARGQYGGLLVCRDQIWQSAGGRGGGGYSTNTKTGCAPGTYNLVTGDCSCPAGYGAVRIAESGSIMAAEGLTRGYICIG